MSDVPCEMTGGITSQTNTPTNAMTATKTAVTARFRDRPRRRKASTIGLSPIARKSEMMIKIKIWLAEASARSIVTASTAPSAARNPK